ncbi:MAG: porin family protein [Bacteroidetes bacterium]|nr:porin family protein [Bacteroidota bacterium]
MKKILLILSIVFAFIAIQAQEESPTLKGKTQLNIGAGLMGWGGLQIYPLHAGIDFFIVNNLSVGFDMNWRLLKSDYNNTDFTHHLFAIQAVIDYHFNEVMKLSYKWDFYAGMKIGPGYITDAENDVNDALNSSVRFFLDARLGVRYYINPKLALNAEGGIMRVNDVSATNSAFTVGLSLKM